MNYSQEFISKCFGDVAILSVALDQDSIHYQSAALYLDDVKQTDTHLLRSPDHVIFVESFSFLYSTPYSFNKIVFNDNPLHFVEVNFTSVDSDTLVIIIGRGQ